MQFAEKETYSVSDLVRIVELLRSEEGCPWDREQTHESIRKNLIEEAYEVLEAIDEKSPAHLREELGDVLFQVVFHAQMEKETGSFDLDDVADDICKKMILRHPHVFAEVKVQNSGEVLKNWDQIKKDTKGQDTYTQTLQAVPKTLPALMRAEKLQKRAARAGMEYPDLASALSDLESEIAELREAVKTGGKEEALGELGDVLFSAVNVARHLSVDPEEALTRSSQRFVDRFSRVEQMAIEKGFDMAQTDFDTLNAFWAEAKKQLKIKESERTENDKD